MPLRPLPCRSGFGALKRTYNEYGLFADESLWITDIRATLPAYHQYRGEQQLAEDEEKIIEFIQEHPEIDSYFAVEYSLARIVYTCLRKLGLQEKMSGCVF
mgnify:CR=1 FL=1